jgi:cytosine/adenosine deaminase-related metal-dependent hydrolase
MLKDPVAMEDSMIDLLLTNGTVITMDSQRRIIDDGAVAVDKGRIIKVGKTGEVIMQFQANKVIDCHEHIILPGLIDAHGHAGHTLFKNLLAERSSFWMKTLTHTYKHFVTDDFWYTEGKLSALERLKAGVTTGVSVMGSMPRSDDAIFGCNHARAYAEAGIREIVCPGPCNPPWPHEFSRWKDGKRIQKLVSYEEVLEGMEGVIQTWNHGANDRIRVFATPFVIVSSVEPSSKTPADRAIELTHHDRYQMRRIREIAAKYHTRIHSDGFGGMIRMVYQQDNALLGPDVHLQHLSGISTDEVEILAETGTHVSSAGSGFGGSRCPVTSLISAGVPVAISTDGTPFDLLQMARKFRLIHTLISQDPFDLPAGKILEMITIDAAKVVGWDDEIGSLEENKKADIITINLKAAHLAPNFLPVHRLILEANGSDVDNVIVDGQMVMQDHQVLTLNEKEVLREAQQESLSTIERAGLKEYLNIPVGFWGKAHLFLGK